MADDALPELRGARVTLRPLAAADSERLRAIRRTKAVADWWGPLEGDFPAGDDDESGATRSSSADEVAGMLQFTEEDEPDWRHAEIDIFLDAAWHGQGYGTEASTTLLEYLTGPRGHHRVVIGTAIENLPARRSYEKAGFRHVGITPRSGRDYRTGEFGDEWFLEYVVPSDEKEA